MGERNAGSRGDIDRGRGSAEMGMKQRSERTDSESGVRVYGVARDTCWTLAAGELSGG